MLAETTAPRIIAPFFGSTVYTWASVLAVSMGGLAAGYYSGGKLSGSPKVVQHLRTILFISFVLCLALPFYWTPVMQFFISSSLRAGTFFSSLIIIFPLLFCFGCVSPIIIGLLSPYYSNQTAIAGTVYGLSSLAGVVVAIICGFWLLPFFGIRESFYVFSTVLFMALISSFFIRSAVVRGSQT